MNGNGTNGDPPNANELADAIRDAGKWAGTRGPEWSGGMGGVADAIREAGSNIGYGGDAVAQALDGGLTSSEVRSKGDNAANVVDALDRVADGLFAIATAIGGARNDPSEHWGGHGLTRGQP